MLKFSYYLVFDAINFEMKSYPKISMCALSDAKDNFIVINNLEEYLKDGKSGLSDEIKPISNLSFILIDDHLWRPRVNGHKFY
jgi:hypothetical protein